MNQGIFLRRRSSSPTASASVLDNAMTVASHSKVVFPPPCSDVGGDLKQALDMPNKPNTTEKSLGGRVNSSERPCLPIEKQRHRLRTTLEQRLREKHSNIDTLQARKVSHCIERLLFLQAQNDGAIGLAAKQSSKKTTVSAYNSVEDFEEMEASSYSDASNLKDRLAPLLHRLVERKAARVAMQARQRDVVLQKGMANGNGQLYSQAVRLVRQIRQQRLAQAAVGCNSRVCQHSDLQHVLAPCSNMADSTTGTLPAAVHAFFFQIPLVNAVEEWSIARLSKISARQWQAWVDQAEQALQDYQEWKQQQQQPRQAV